MARSGVRRASPHLEAALAEAFPGGLPVEGGEAAAPLSSEDMARVTLAVARSLFGRPFSGMKELDGYLGHAMGGESRRRTDALNAAMLPLKGTGADCVWINAWTGPAGMRGWRTLLEWDVARHGAEESGRQSEGEPARPWCGTLDGEWAWLLGGDGNVRYLALSCAPAALRRVCVDRISGALAGRWPVEWVGERLDGGGMLMTPVPEDRACERSSVFAEALAEVDARMYGPWKEAFDALPAGVARPERPDPLLPEDGGVGHLVFPGAAALGAVRFGDFIDSLSGLPDLTGEVGKVMERGERDFSGWLEGLLSRRPPSC